MPFVLSPQAWEPPALTAVKVPAGGVAWPLELAPQQARVPFVLDAAGEVTVPAARPRRRRRCPRAGWPGRSRCRPSRRAVPFVLTPQVWMAAGAHRGEGARGRGGLAVAVVAPAGDGAVRLHPAGVVVAGAHRGEGARGRGGLAVAVVAPAGEGAVRPHAAGVEAAGAHRGEGARGRGRLAVGRCAPAGDGAVRSSPRRCGCRRRSPR